MKSIALITCVSRQMGLGYEIARQMCQQNYKVIITARDMDKVTELSEKLNAEGNDTVPLALDILSESSIKNLASKIEEHDGKLDVLINNAGGFYDAIAKPLEVDFDFVQKAFETNVLGAWRMAIAFAPLLQKSDNGTIVNVSSGAGAFTDPGFGIIAKNDVPVYGVTKLALNGLTVKLSHQLKEMGIKINAVCPGFTATYPGTEQWGARPVADGAKGIVWAATLPKDGPTGGFYRDGHMLNW